VTLSAATTFDTVLSLRRGSCTAAASEVACADDVAAQVRAELEVEVDPYQTYYVILDGAGAAAGDYELVIELTSCSDALAYPNSFYGASWGQVLALADWSQAKDSVSASCATTGTAERVFRIEPDADGTLIAETTTPFTAFDTVLSVREGGCGATSRELACDSYQRLGGSRVEVPVEGHQVYYVVVEGADGIVGNLGFRATVCGDSSTSAMEGCDNGEVNEWCDSRCQSWSASGWCGDGIVSPGMSEQCDDGNAFSGDGCDAGCQRVTSCQDAADATWALGIASVTGSTAGAPDDATPTCGAGGSGERVFTLDAPGTGTLTASTANPGTTYDTVVSIRTTCDAASTEIGCDDDAAAPQSTATAAVTTGNRYYIIVDGRHAEGDFELTLTLTP
jgi:cysteine-rich repeat protein